MKNEEDATRMLQGQYKFGTSFGFSGDMGGGHWFTSLIIDLKEQVMLLQKKQLTRPLIEWVRFRWIF